MRLSLRVIHVQTFAPRPASDDEIGERPRAGAKPQHVFVLGNDVAMLVNFRGPLIKAMLAAGHRVSAGAAGRNANAERCKPV